LGRRPLGTIAADLILTGLVLHESIWVYELSNYVSLVLGGANAFQTVQSILPVRVSTASSVPSLVKLVQVVICSFITILLLWVTKNHRLPFTKVALITTISLDVASFQWELLSQINYATEAVHQGTFLLITLVLGGLMAAALRRPLRLGLGWFDTSAVQ
jgi:hypothetical protein